jgi:hypothetical protein
MRFSIFLLLVFLLTVCIQKIQSNIIPVRGANPELILTGPTPGITGMDNTLFVSGATPYERVYFINGFIPGSTAIPGCPGDSVGINSPRILGFSEADFEGNASYTNFVRPGASGRMILFQAIENAHCMVSNLVEYTFAPGSFERTYGGSDYDWGYSVQQTTDGGYIVAGWTESLEPGGRDVYLFKTDASGDTVWTRTYDNSTWDGATSVRQTTDGGYIIAGGAGEYFWEDADAYLIRTNSSGDTLWTRTYGGHDGDEFRSLQLTTDGGYIVAGATISFGAGASDVYLIKTNPSGDTLWTRTYGGYANDLARSVQQTTDGGYIIAGDTWSFGAADSANAYLIRTNPSGDTLWTRTYGGNLTDEGYSVQQTTDGGYIVAGYTRSFGAGSRDVYLIKTNASGDTLWTRTYGGPSADIATMVQQTSDGGYIIAGRTYSFGAGNRDVYLIKTDPYGDMLWTRTYGGSEDDDGWSVQQTTDGGYIVAGRTESFGAGGDLDGGNVYLIKTDTDGLVGINEDDPR